jgi:hypothetical protein
MRANRDAARLDGDFVVLRAAMFRRTQGVDLLPVAFRWPVFWRTIHDVHFADAPAWALITIITVPVIRMRPVRLLPRAPVRMRMRMAIDPAPTPWRHGAR